MHLALKYPRYSTTVLTDICWRTLGVLEIIKKNHVVLVGFEPTPFQFARQGPLTNFTTEQATTLRSRKPTRIQCQPHALRRNSFGP